jgi:phosphate transport system permease protein
LRFHNQAKQHPMNAATMTLPRAPQATLFASRDMAAIARRQRWQDALFHRGTQAVSLLVLAALAGVLASLLVAAWPAFEKFGLAFLWTVEWDPVGERFGAAIAITGTLLSAGLALIIAVPLAWRAAAGCAAPESS